MHIIENDQRVKKIKEPLPGFLVCWRIMALMAIRLSSKFHLLAICSNFGHFFSLKHYPPTYQPERVYLLSILQVDKSH